MEIVFSLFFYYHVDNQFNNRILHFFRHILVGNAQKNKKRKFVLDFYKTKNVNILKLFDLNNAVYQCSIN